MQSAIGSSCPAEESNWHHRARPNRRKSRYPFIRSLPTHSCRGANSLLTQRPTAGLLPADDTEGAIRFGDKPFYESMFAQLPRKLESRKASAGTRFAISIRLCCEVLALSSKSCGSCYATQLCDPLWMSTRKQLRRPNMWLRAAVLSLVFSVKQIQPCIRPHLLTLQHERSAVASKVAKGDTKKGTKTCPFESLMVPVKSELFWNEWRGRRDSNPRPLP